MATPSVRIQGSYALRLRAWSSTLGSTNIGSPDGLALPKRSQAGTPRPLSDGQRPVGTIHRPRRYGRAIYPAREGHVTRPLNAHGSLGIYSSDRLGFASLRSGTASPASWRRRRDDCERRIGADQLKWTPILGPGAKLE